MRRRRGTETIIFNHIQFRERGFQSFLTLGTQIRYGIKHPRSERPSSIASSASAQGPDAAGFVAVGRPPGAVPRMPYRYNKTPDRGAGLALVPSFAQLCPQPTSVDFLTDADGHFMEIVNFYEFLLRLAGIFADEGWKYSWIFTRSFRGNKLVTETVGG